MQLFKFTLECLSTYKVRQTNMFLYERAAFHATLARVSLHAKLQLVFTREVVTTKTVYPDNQNRCESL
jgi:hypothetical protein